MENLIISYDALKSATEDLQRLSTEITNTLQKIQNAYENQGKGWSSASSNQQSQKMVNYTDEANKIAKNIREVSEAIEKFKTMNQNIDENGTLS